MPRSYATNDAGILLQSQPAMNYTSGVTDIRSQTLEELQKQFAEWQQPAYRVTQLLEWLYAKRATTWDAMSNLPKALRGKLAETYSFYSLELAKNKGRRIPHRNFFGN